MSASSNQQPRTKSSKSEYRYAYYGKSTYINYRKCRKFHRIWKRNFLIESQLRKCSYDNLPIQMEPSINFSKNKQHGIVSYQLNGKRLSNLPNRYYMHCKGSKIWKLRQVLAFQRYLIVSAIGTKTITSLHIITAITNSGLLKKMSKSHFSQITYFQSLP